MNWEKILYWALVIFIIYIIIEIIRNILGGSLAFESLVIALLAGNMFLFFHLKSSIRKIDSKLSEHIGWHKGKDSR